LQNAKCKLQIANCKLQIANWNWRVEIETKGKSVVSDCVDRLARQKYASLMDYSKIITFEPGKRSGKPCICGVRITVSDVLGYLAGGMSIEEILEDFPKLTEEDIRACLAAPPTVSGG